MSVEPNILMSAWEDIVSVEGCEECRYDHHGLWTIEIDGETFAIGTDDECDKACSDYIGESVWAFNPSFVISYTNIPSFLEDALGDYMSKNCENCNDDLRNEIVDFEQFVSDAISADGRGHFLAGYDDEELELGIDSNGDYIYAYRIE